MYTLVPLTDQERARLTSDCRACLDDFTELFSRRPIIRRVLRDGQPISSMLGQDLTWLETFPADCGLSADEEILGCNDNFYVFSPAAICRGCGKTLHPSTPTDHCASCSAAVAAVYRDESAFQRFIAQECCDTCDQEENAFLDHYLPDPGIGPSLCGSCDGFIENKPRAGCTNAYHFEAYELTQGLPQLCSCCDRELDGPLGDCISTIHAEHWSKVLARDGC